MCPLEKKPIKVRNILSSLDFGSGDTLDPFCLRKDKFYIFSSDDKAVMAVGLFGKVMIASGDPIGDVAQFENCIEKSLEFVKSAGLKPLYLMIRSDRLGLYTKYGLKSTLVAQEAVVDVENFSLKGGSMRNLRQAIARAKNHGVLAAVFKETELAKSEFYALRQFVNGNRKVNKGFTSSLDNVFEAELDQSVVIVARNANGPIVGIQRYLLAKGSSCLSLDLMIKSADAPNGCNELMIFYALEYAKAHRIVEVSLNIIGLRHLFSGEKNRTSLSVIKATNPFRAKSLNQFVEKFNPNWIDRYACFIRVSDLPILAKAAIKAEKLLSE
jgi:lysylphosphatidylglycerol synthetase-like protein (DUF2156 family)